MKTNIEILLGEWGAWRRGENRSALGYPEEAAFSKMRVDGLRGADPGALLVDDDLRQLDAEIERLHADYRAMLMVHYVALGPVKRKADRMEISPRQYYLHLEHAHRVLAHTMGGKYATGFEPKLCTHVAQVCAQN